MNYLFICFFFDIHYLFTFENNKIIPMKKLFIILVAVLPFLASAQDENESAITIGISGGFDKGINAYRQYPNKEGNTFSSSDPNYNIALDFGILASPKLRPRVELRYVQMAYTADWLNTTDNGLLKETKVKLFNFDINFHLDYLLLNSSKFQIYASPVLKWEFNLDREFKNTNLDGTHNYKQYNDIYAENPKNVLGGGASVILKYNINKYLGITLTPEYTVFFREFVKANDKIYQRTSVNLGVEFKFGY